MCKEISRFIVLNRRRNLLFVEGAIIPKGSEIGIVSYVLHRNAEIYPEPEKFDPERFAEGVYRPPYSYIPFSAGPRNCIGVWFAII